MSRPAITHHNAPFGEVGLDCDFNPPGYNQYHKTHDYIPPCDQFPGGTWLRKETPARKGAARPARRRRMG